MKILSHRGIVEDIDNIPNSYTSLFCASEEGFSLETDIRFSKDKKLIINHDVDMQKTIGMSELIKDTTYLDLKKNNAIVSEKIPELDTIFKNVKESIVPNNLIALHIKDFNNKELLYFVINLIKEFELEENCFLFDLLLENAKKFKKEFPDIKIGVSVGEKNYGPTIYTQKDVVEYLKYIDIIWADEWQSDLYKEEFFQYYKELGKEIYLISPELHIGENHKYSKNPIELWKKIYTFQFDGICTDFPKKAEDFFNSK